MVVEEPALFDPDHLHHRADGWVISAEYWRCMAGASEQAQGERGERESRLTWSRAPSAGFDVACPLPMLGHSPVLGMLSMICHPEALLLREGSPGMSQTKMRVPGS